MMTKLQHLKGIIARSWRNRSIGNRKVIIFTAFADTANYLYANLAPALLQSNGIHTGKVTGSDAPKTTLKKAMISIGADVVFAKVKEKHLILPEEPASSTS
jgi:ERCC4-related helicase